MAQEIINKDRTFNRPRVRNEIDALGLTMQMRFSGFDSAPFRRLVPFPEATRVISRRRQSDGSILEDVAAKGDIRFEKTPALTPAEITSINGVLDAHDDTIDNPKQARQRQQVADVAELRTIFDGGIPNRTIELTAKLILRDYGEDI